MHYCKQENDAGNSPGKSDNESADDEETKRERKLLPKHIKPITEQTVSNDHKIHDVLDQMVAKFKENQVKDFVSKVEVEAEDANFKEEPPKSPNKVYNFDMQEKSSACSIYDKETASLQKVQKGVNDSLKAYYSAQDPDMSPDNKTFGAFNFDQSKHGLPTLAQMIQNQKLSGEVLELQDLKKAHKRKRRKTMLVKKSEKDQLQSIKRHA